MDLRPGLPRQVLANRDKGSTLDMIGIPERPRVCSALTRSSPDFSVN